MRASTNYLCLMHCPYVYNICVCVKLVMKSKPSKLVRVQQRDLTQLSLCVRVCVTVPLTNWLKKPQRIAYIMSFFNTSTFTSCAQKKANAFCKKITKIQFNGRMKRNLFSYSYEFIVNSISIHHDNMLKRSIQRMNKILSFLSESFFFSFKFQTIWSGIVC